MREIFLQHPWIVVLILAWSIPWKAVALWKSARRGHLGWFIVFVIINTLGILEIIYIFIFSKRGLENKAEGDVPKDNPAQRMAGENGRRMVIM